MSKIDELQEEYAEILHRITEDSKRRKRGEQAEIEHNETLRLGRRLVLIQREIDAINASKRSLE